MTFDDLIKYLKKQGYKPNRTNYDINKIIKFLEEKNYPIFPDLIEFLEKFDGYKFKFPLHKSKIKFLDSKDLVVFDCIKQTELDSGIEEIYEKAIGERLVILGENSFYYTIMMSTSGKIYAARDGYFRLIGNNHKEALVNYYNLENFKEIDLIYDPCTFRNQILHINECELEHYKNEFNAEVVIEFDGKKCAKWNDYLDEFDKWWEVYKRNCGMENYGLSHYYKTMDYHFYYLHYFVNTLDRKDSYLLVIKNYDEFLSKDLDIKAQYEEKCVEKILRYYDDVAGQCYATDYKKFNILLVK